MHRFGPGSRMKLREEWAADGQNDAEDQHG